MKIKNAIEQVTKIKNAIEQVTMIKKASKPVIFCTQNKRTTKLRLPPYKKSQSASSISLDHPKLVINGSRRVPTKLAASKKHISDMSR